MQTAKLFVNGRSQAVRLPKPFRFDGLTEVFIERDGDRVILSPTRRPSVERLIAALDALPSRIGSSLARPIAARRCDAGCGHALHARHQHLHLRHQAPATVGGVSAAAA